MINKSNKFKFKNMKESLKKIMKNGKIMIVPMDHGASSGPIEGLEDMKKIIGEVRAGGADAIVIHKGVYKQCKKEIGDLPVFIHISVSTDSGNPIKKVLVASAQEVKNLGAQGVSIHVNIGNEYDSEMLADLGKISAECDKLGLPLLAMIYVRRETLGDIITKTDQKSVAIAARTGYELGADIVKVSYTGDAESFKKVVDGCAIPVIIAGGAKGGDENTFLESIKDVIKIGCAGTSIGRKIFQHQNPREITKKIKEIIQSN